jgi:hypothetical protein
MDGSNNINEDYDSTHPLPALPAPVHHGFQQGPGHGQKQEQEQEQEQEPDEPMSLQFASSTSRINNNSNSTSKQDEDLSDIPPPLPSKKTFYITHPSSNSDKEKKYSYNYTPPTSSPTFLENFMSRHPKISRHRRRFAALLFTIVFLLLLLITLLAVLLTRKNDGFTGDGGIGGGSGGAGDGYGQPGNEWGEGATATIEELRKHNAGISPPPINRSNEPGWTNTGKGEGTFYGKWVYGVEVCKVRMVVRRVVGNVGLSSYCTMVSK